MSVYPTAAVGTLTTLSTLGAGSVASPEELNRLLDELERMARQNEVGDGVELRVDDQEVLMVDIEPIEHGWAARYQNGKTQRYTCSLNGSGDESGVEWRWAGEWGETEAQCFIDPAVARRAALHFLETRQLTDEVIWL